MNGANFNIVEWKLSEMVEVTEERSHERPQPGVMAHQIKVLTKGFLKYS